MKCSKCGKALTVKELLIMSRKRESPCPACGESYEIGFLARIPLIVALIALVQLDVMENFGFLVFLLLILSLSVGYKLIGLTIKLRLRNSQC